MKKLVSFLFSIIMVFALIGGCGGSDPEPETKEPEQIEEAEADPAEETAAKLNAIADVALTDVLSTLNDSGFVITYKSATADTDLTDLIADFSDEELAAFYVDRVAAASFDQTAEVFLLSQSEYDQKHAREILEEKLSEATVMWACEEYGKQEFPYGFDIHSVTGRLAMEAIDENTWFYKCECTTTNAFNAKYDGIMEAVVSGTNDNPVVEEFYVY